MTLQSDLQALEKLDPRSFQYKQKRDQIMRQYGAENAPGFTGPGANTPTALQKTFHENPPAGTFGLPSTPFGKSKDYINLDFGPFGQGPNGAQDLTPAGAISTALPGLEMTDPTASDPFANRQFLANEAAAQQGADAQGAAAKSGQLVAKLLESLRAPGGGGVNLNGSIDLGTAPQYPAPPRTELPNAPDLSTARSYLDQSRPTAPGPQSFDDKLGNIAYGLLAGAANAPANANFWQRLALAGAGAAGGALKNRQEVKAEQKTYESELRRYMASRAEYETAAAQGDYQTALQRAQIAQNDALNAWQFKVKQLEQEQPQIHGMNNGIVYYSTQGPDGKRKLNFADSGLLDKLTQLKTVGKGLGADPIKLDLAGTDLALDPRTKPVDTLYLVADALKNRGLLPSVLGPEVLQQAYEGATKAATQANPTLGANPKLYQAEVTKNLYGFLVSYWIQNPTDLQAAFAALGYGVTKK